MAVIPSSMGPGPLPKPPFHSSEPTLLANPVSRSSAAPGSIRSGLLPVASCTSLSPLPASYIRFRPFAASIGVRDSAGDKRR